MEPEKLEGFIYIAERAAIVDRILWAWGLADKRDEKHVLRKEWIDKYLLPALEEYGLDVRKVNENL